MTNLCTGTTKQGHPCKNEASKWPEGVDGNPRRCGTHMTLALRTVRDNGFAEQERRHRERLAERDPACWGWPSPATAVHAEGDEQAAHRALATWHADRCAVCGLKGFRLIVDHDHVTGLVRGLLCRSCNGQEPHDDGLFGKYRDRPPASILGVRVRYYDPFNGFAQPRAPRGDHLDDHPAYGLAAKLAGHLGENR